MLNEFDDITVVAILSYWTGAEPVGNEGRNTSNGYRYIRYSKVPHIRLCTDLFVKY
jgi:hypothetical protein